MAAAVEFANRSIERLASRKPLDLLFTVGDVEFLRTEGTDNVLLLPSRTVSESYLDRSLWNRKVQMGNFRSVYSVDSLQTGEDPGLVVRSAERRFTSDPKRLAGGDIWWGGPKSNDRPIHVADPLVDAQTLWEATYLLELWKKGIPAEIPQAVIIGENGGISLVVNRIDEAMVERRGPTHEELMERVRCETDLVPNDASSYNTLVDAQGDLTIIDVNRWKWPPYTDESMSALVNLIQSKL